MASFADRYGPWAFIAGASMGIGAALSHEAAARGCNVVLARPRQGGARRDRGGDRRAARRGDAACAGRSAPTLTSEAWWPRPSTTWTWGCSSTTPRWRRPAASSTTDLDLHLLSVQGELPDADGPVPLLRPAVARAGPRGIGMVSSNGGTQGAVELLDLQRRQGLRVDPRRVAVGGVEGPWRRCHQHLRRCHASANYHAFQETLDPELCNRA